VLAEMRARYRVPAWSLGGGLLGTRAQVRETKRQLRRRLAPLGRVLFVDDRLAALGGRLAGMANGSALGRVVASVAARVSGRSIEMLAAGPHVHSVLKGIPSDYFVRHAYFKSRLPKPDVADPDRDDVGLIWFAPIAPMTGEHVARVIGLCRPLFDKYEFDFYVALLMQNARSMIALMSIYFRKEVAGEAERAGQLYAALGAATHAAGYQPYRISVIGMEGPGVGRADSSRAAVRAMKAALDPGAVLAPGKYGI
ncbi:MAG: hypothetical protein IT450_16150, partial [Phycisphaerales bacterium]|nr:hypothetical protein [Phycisphaerales bacterium]